MKFLTREELNKLSAEEKQAYFDKLYELRRFACAMVKDVSRSAVGKLEHRCIGSAGNFVDYESSMYIYLTNAVYRHILGEENLERARSYRNRAQDQGKTGVTIPSVLSLEGQVHLKNFYRYIEEKLFEDPKLKFRNNSDVQNFLRETRKEYADDHHINFAFAGRTSDCVAQSVVAKTISSLERLLAVGRISKTKEYPVFDEYTIKSMEINEYLLSRARSMAINPLYIKEMEVVLEQERLAIVADAGKSGLVKDFYRGSVADVLGRMNGENEKAKLIANVKKNKGRHSESAKNLTENANSIESEFGGDSVATGIKDALIRRNSIGVELISIKPDREGFLKDNTAELKPASPNSVQSNLFKANNQEKKSEDVKEVAEQSSKEKGYRDAMYVLDYELASGRIDQSEYEERVEELRHKGMANSRDCDYAYFEPPTEKCEYTKDEEENILEDENGQIRLF